MKRAGNGELYRLHSVRATNGSEIRSAYGDIKPIQQITNNVRFR